MKTMNWGYNISKPRSIDIDTNDMRYSRQLLMEHPELQTCIACGLCTATCTAGNFTDFSLRKVHTLVRRGEYKGVVDELNKCMLCGKCRLICPRGINTREIVLIIKKQLSIK